MTYFDPLYQFCFSKAIEKSDRDFNEKESGSIEKTNLTSFWKRLKYF
jgi:hypothetical protein